MWLNKPCEQIKFFFKLSLVLRVTLVSEESRDLLLVGRLLLTTTLITVVGWNPCGFLFSCESPAAQPSLWHSGVSVTAAAAIVTYRYLQASSWCARGFSAQHIIRKNSHQSYYLTVRHAAVTASSITTQHRISGASPSDLLIAAQRKRRVNKWVQYYSCKCTKNYLINYYLSSTIFTFFNIVFSYTNLLIYLPWPMKR